MSLANRTLVILLLAGMMVQISCVQVYRVLFAMNRKAIAERLCEKRTMECGGCCFLHKKIASEQESRETPADNSMPSKPLPDSMELMPGLAPDVPSFNLVRNSSLSFCVDGTAALTDGHAVPPDPPPDIYPRLIAA